MDEDSGIVGVMLANRDRIGRFLRARLGDDGDAEDVLQEVWLKVRALGSGPVADPLAYLFRMAANAALDRRRATQRRERRDHEWAEHAGVDDMAPARTDAEHALIVRDELARVEEALQALPERTVRVFRAYRVEGLSQRVIAAEQGISLSAVEKHLQRAYRAIVAVRAELDADKSFP